MYPIFSSPLVTAIILVAVLSGFIAALELPIRSGTLTPQTSRRAVHVVVGLMVVATPFLFDRPTIPIMAALVLAGANFILSRRGQVRSLHGIDRKSYGTFYFPLGFAIVAGLFWDRDPVAMLLSILILTFADPLAGWVGQRVKAPSFTLWRDPKTWPGTATMFAASAVIIGAGQHFLALIAGGQGWSPVELAVGLPLAAAIVTIAEVLSKEGSDNLTVPLAGAAFLALFHHLGPAQMPTLAMWSAGSAAILLGAHRLGALTTVGLPAAWAMGLFIFLAGGWPWVLPIIIFFVSSSILTRLRPKTEAGEPSVQQVRGRDLIQVTANGGWAMAAAIAYGIWGAEDTGIIFLAAIAAATADTWATEIGSWSPTPPRDIMSWQTVPAGQSGGITLLGTAGSLLGALLIALAGSLSLPSIIGPQEIILLTTIGFSSALADSWLGSAFQVRYQLEGDVTSEIAPSEGAKVASGWRWLDNNMVNLVVTGLASALGLIYVLVKA